MVDTSSASKYVAEFVGTYLLVFTVGCNVLSGSPVWAPTSIGCVLMVSIYALGGVSGANFNPAVSLSLGLSNKLEWLDVTVYCLMQFSAGIAAALTYGGLFGKVFNLSPSPGFGWWETMLAETLYTFMLCFVVLNVAASTKSNPKDDPNQYYGLAIGFVIIAGAYGAGSISGGAFNPAVAMSIDMTSLGIGFGWGFAYMGYELIGAFLAAGLFRIVRPEEFGGDTGSISLSTKCISEFIGTFFLVLTVGLNVLSNSPAPVWSIGASLMCMVYALGNVSGGHFNPAVTLAIILSGRGKCTTNEAIAYVPTQLLAGVCASLVYSAMHHGAVIPLEPGKGYQLPQVAVAEIIATFLLCYVVLCVATVEKPLKDFFGIAIGSCVTTGGYAIGAISGGSLNPAVSVGISLGQTVSGKLLTNCLAYSAFELIGGGVAAALFRVTHPHEFSKGKSQRV